MCFFLFYSSSSYEDFCLLFSHSQGIVVWNVTKYVKYVSSFCFEKSQHAQKDVNNINLLWEFFVLVALVVVEWMCPATFQTPPPSKSLRFWVIVFVKHWPKPDQANCVELWGNRKKSLTHEADFFHHIWNICTTSQSTASLNLLSIIIMNLLTISAGLCNHVMKNKSPVMSQMQTLMSFWTFLLSLKNFILK